MQATIMDDLAAELERVRAQYGLTFADVAGAIGLSRSTISLFAQSKRTINEESKVSLRAFLERYVAEHDARGDADTENVPVDGELYKTNEFILAIGWCNFIRTERKMGALIGHPGIGKTTIIRHYADITPGVVLLEAWPNMRMSDFLNMLAAGIGAAVRGNSYEKTQQIINYLRENKDVTIVIDEAEYLRTWDVNKFEILRKIWDSTGVPTILCGTLELENMLTRGTGRSNLAQLYRRKMEIKLKGITKAEARDILSRYQVDPDAAELLTKIAADTSHGGMGNFCEVLHMCRRTAKGQRITREIVESAMRFKLMF